MSTCLVCNEKIEPFMSFGRMPIANGFLSPDQFDGEFFFDLQVGFCPNCCMVQLIELVEKEMMFNENYAFFSSTSTGMAMHFRDFAETIINDLDKETDPFIVEIGSNDGILLRHFSNLGIRHLGIEPSANVAQVAINRGVRTVSKFFDEKLARDIVDENGQADFLVGANVMCHIPNLHSVAAGIKILLKPKGLLIFEDPYLGDIIEKISYDQIYDEHAFYFSVASIKFLFEQHGFELIDIQHQNVHGGSMRYVIAQQGEYPVSKSVQTQCDKEHFLGLQRAETYETLRRNIEHSRDDLMFLLRSVQRRGKRVVGYAATSKSTTVINYCGITPELVEFICDTTPIKQGKYSPGAHIPVRPYEAFNACYPDYALLFGWNHAEEIMAKEQSFKASGGKWIVYVPQVQVIE